MDDAFFDAAEAVGAAYPGVRLLPVVVVVVVVTSGVVPVKEPRRAIEAAVGRNSDDDEPEPEAREVVDGRRPDDGRAPSTVDAALLTGVFVLVAGFDAFLTLGGVCAQTALSLPVDDCGEVCGVSALLVVVDSGCAVSTTDVGIGSRWSTVVCPVVVTATSSLPDVNEGAEGDVTIAEHRSAEMTSRWASKTPAELDRRTNESSVGRSVDDWTSGTRSPDGAVDATTSGGDVALTGGFSAEVVTPYIFIRSARDMTPTVGRTTGVTSPVSMTSFFVSVPAYPP